MLTVRDIYINSNLNSLTNSPAAAEALSLKYPPMGHLSNDHKDLPCQHENNHKLYDETGHPIVTLMKS